MSFQPLIDTTKRHHLLFTIVTLFYWFSMYMYVPILSPYLNSLGYSVTIIGFILGSYGLTQLLIRFPLGMLSDRIHRRKPFIVLGMLTGVLSCLIFMLHGSWLLALLARVIAGVCASTWVAFTVLYAAYFAEKDAATAMSNASFMTGAGQLLSMTASGFLAEKYGWNATFTVGAIFGLVGLALSLFIKEPPEGVRRTPISIRTLSTVATNKWLLQVSWLSILAHMVLFITMFGFTPLQATAIGASKNELTIIVVAFMLPHALFSWLTGRWLAPRFGAWRVILVGFAASCVTTLAIPLCSSVWSLAATQAVNGLAQGLHMPLLLALAIERFESAKRATAMGFYQAVYSVGLFAGPFIAGALNDHLGLASGFWLGGLIAAIAMVQVAGWRKNFHNHSV